MEGTVYTIIPKEKGIYGYIKCPDKNYYYDNSSLTKGIYLKKGAKVEFDVAAQPDGREKAANIKLLLMLQFEIPLKKSCPATLQSRRFWNCLIQPVCRRGIFRCNCPINPKKGWN